jgi:hypothetical protein
MQIHDSLPPVADIVVPNLDPDEKLVLLDCINKVRAGELEYYVTVTNRKVTKSRKRLPDRDYRPDPALVPYAHKGWLVAAPINQKGLVYLHIYDEARAKSAGDKFGHTRVTMEGIQSFTVEHDPRTFEPITRPGPLADPDDHPAAASEHPDPVTDPLLVAANALFTQAQACTQMGQALLAQAAVQAQARINPPSL